MNTKREHPSKLLWLSGLVLVLVAGTAMAGDHHGGVRFHGGIGFYVAPPVYPVYPVSPPVVVYSQPYYAQPYYYAPPVIVEGYWAGPRSYYVAPWGHGGYWRHRR
jgi:hypothetical protein